MAAVAAVDPLSQREQLATDFTAYAPACLIIRPKAGPPRLMQLNRCQRFIHERVEEQLRKRGWVRAILVKSRQQGASTYVAGRFFWKTTHRFGFRTFILAHEEEATNNLFGFVDRFHANLPHYMQPSLGASNAKELFFDALDSGYKVGTAGSTGIGRSQTVQLFHGSEVGFWKNADKHVDGVMQAVPMERETEIFLESTANGMGGFFHRSTTAALKGEGDFIVIFTPWFWSDEYQREPDPEIEYSVEWTEYADLHGINERQLAWAYAKNVEFCNAVGADPNKGPSWKFRQEYPATVHEAFQGGGEGLFIRSEIVLRARRAMIKGTGPVILGVDPARGGGDKTGVISRHGRSVGKHSFERWDETNLMTVAARVAKLMNKIQQQTGERVFANIDTTGVGGGVYDRLVEAGFESQVFAVNFGEEAQEPEEYVNRRAEMWDRMRAAIDDRTLQLDIPDDDGLQADLCAVTWGKGATRFVGKRLQLEAKDHIRERLGISPDIGDALALTFANPMPVYAVEPKHPDPRDYQPPDERTDYERYDPFKGV